MFDYFVDMPFQKNLKRLVLQETTVKKPLRGRMFSVQESLPRLPVPPLQKTLEKFLRSVKPVLSDDDFKRAQKLCYHLSEYGSEAHHLQQLLEKRSKEKVNWLKDWWLSIAYLEFRSPTAIHVNPGLLFPSQNFSDQRGQLKYAAQLVEGILDYKIMVDEQTLPVEQLGGKPLCMMQYYEILSSCRIPGRKHDSVVRFPPDQPNPPRHIIVAHNNHFFSVELYGKSNKPLTVEQLYHQFCEVVEQSQKPTKPVGILTTDGRNTWAKVYEKLMKDKTNKRSIEKIQRSIFMLCLDQPNKHTSPDTLMSVVANQMNHGGGSHLNTGNRWFDKTMQFIVGLDGSVGLNYEHAPAEGPPIVALVDHALGYVKRGRETRLPAAGVGHPEKLEFVLSRYAEDAIESAKENVDSTIADLNLQAFTFTTFGKNFIKTQRLSPDAFFQVCLQLAYFRMYGESCSTYESGSLRRFQHGRTETIRSCTIEAKEFARSMGDPKVLPLGKADNLRKAITQHRKYTDDVISGQGIDRHLLGLKQTAIENGLNIPDFFLDSIYTTSVHWKLSTSQVPSREHALLCFAPVVPDGYGVCYNPQDDAIHIAVSSWNSSPDTDAPKLAQFISNALQDCQKLLTETQIAKL